MSAGTVHPGSFCSPEGGTGSTTRGTPMVCSIGANGGRARWRGGSASGSGSGPVSTVNNVVALEPEPVSGPAAATSDTSHPAQEAHDWSQPTTPRAAAGGHQSLEEDASRTSREVPDRLRTGRGVTVTWEGGKPIESGTPVEVSYDPTTGTAYEYDTDGQRHELRAGEPAAIGAQLLYMREKIRTGPDHGITRDKARELLGGLTVEQLKAVGIEIGFPGGSRTKQALVEEAVGNSVGFLLDSYAIHPRWGR